MPSSGMTIRVSSRLAKVKCFKSTFILESFFPFSLFWVHFCSFIKKDALKAVERRKRKKVTVTRIFPDKVRVGSLPCIKGMLLLMAEQGFWSCSREALLAIFLNGRLQEQSLCTSDVLSYPNTKRCFISASFRQKRHRVTFMSNWFSPRYSGLNVKDQGELVLWVCNLKEC